MAVVLVMHVCFVALIDDDDRGGNYEHPECGGRANGALSREGKGLFALPPPPSVVHHAPLLSLYERYDHECFLCGAISGVGVPAFLFRSSYLSRVKNREKKRSKAFERREDTKRRTHEKRRKDKKTVRTYEV